MQKWLRLAVPVLLLLLSSSAGAAPLEWQGRAVPHLQGDLTAITYGNGLYVAVSNQGSVAVSADGVTWSSHPLLERFVFSDVAYGDGRFVAVGARGKVVSSGNGAGWRSLLVHRADDLHAVSYCQKQFVAVGSGGAILTIADDNLALRQKSPVELELRAVACSDQRIVAVGEGGTVLTSSDGVKWEGATWGADPTLTLKTIAWGPAGFIAAGQGQAGQVVLHSEDGLKWTSAPAGAPKGIVSVTFGAGQYAAVVPDENGPFRALTSTDLKHWSVQVLGNVAEVLCAAPGCVGSFRGLASVVHAPASAPASPPAQANTALKALVYGEGRYVGLTQAGQVVSSADLKAWRTSPAVPGTGTQLHGLAYHSNLFVAVGSGGTIMLSRDRGVTWTLQNSGTKATLRAIISAEGMLVVVGEGGTILNSADGLNWSRFLAGSQIELTGITYTGGQFVVTGTDGTLLSSLTGRTWTEHEAPALAPPEYLSSQEASRVKRIAIRPALAATAADRLVSGLPYRFDAIGYDAAGAEVGAVRPVWGIVYGIIDPWDGRAPLATINADGRFVGHGTGTVRLRAYWGGLFAESDLQVVPGEVQPGQKRFSPLLRPVEYASISPHKLVGDSHRVTVGQTYKFIAQGMFGNRVGGSFPVYWSITYRVPLKDGPMAVIDAEGNLTAYEPGAFEVMASTGDDAVYYSVTAVK